MLNKEEKNDSTKKEISLNDFEEVMDVVKG